MAAIALAALGFVPTEEPAWADHGGPHDPDVVVTGTRPPALLEFCSQNPHHEICGHGAGGGGGGMVICPHTGLPVSRPESCPEFSGSGGCADSSSSGCGSDDDGDADEEDLPESARTAADKVMACVSNSLLKGLYGRVESTVYQDLSHRGDHRLAEIRVDFDLDGDSMMTSAVFREIRFDGSAIQEEA